MTNLPSNVQELVELLNGIGQIDDYEAGKAAEQRLKQELSELGYVVRYHGDEDGGSYTAIRKSEAR